MATTSGSTPTGRTSGKWEELASQGLRLIGLQEYDGLWAGIWREGNDAYYLWVDANESAFLAKWGGLAAQGLRLIDVFAAPFGGTGGAATRAGRRLRRSTWTARPTWRARSSRDLTPASP